MTQGFVAGVDGGWTEGGGRVEGGWREGGWREGGPPAKRMGSRFLCWLEWPAGFEMPSRPSIDVHQAAAWVGPEIRRAAWAADAVLKSP